ncbi:MAG: urease accessory protein UreD [Spirochaetes bacterium]|nr:urease accessory protein UreD [Spirochaetota bacterium]
MGNRYPQLSDFFLRVKKGKDVSVLEDIRFTAPFKITSPFYDAGGRLQVMLMSVSAGLMEGDTQRMQIDVGDGADLELLSQSFEKIHKMDGGGSALRQINLNVGKAAALFYAPLPTIPYAHSAFSSVSEIHLADVSSTVFYCDILAAGRVARGECFAYKRYSNRVKAYRAGELIYSDNTFFEPARMKMDGFCLLEGFTHSLNIFFSGPALGENTTESIMEQIHDVIHSWQAPAAGVAHAKGGASLTGNGDICVRALANGSEPLISLEHEIKRLLCFP